MLQTGATRPRVQLQRDFHQNRWRAIFERTLFTTQATSLKYREEANQMKWQKNEK